MNLKSQKNEKEPFLIVVIVFASPTIHFFFLHPNSLNVLKLLYNKVLDKIPLPFWTYRGKIHKSITYIFSLAQKLSSHSNIQITFVCKVSVSNSTSIIGVVKPFAGKRSFNISSLETLNIYHQWQLARNRSWQNIIKN